MNEMWEFEGEKYRCSVRTEDIEMRAYDTREGKLQLVRNEWKETDGREDSRTTIQMVVQDGDSTGSASLNLTESDSVKLRDALDKIIED